MAADPLQDWYQELADATGNTSLRRVGNAAGRKAKEAGVSGAKSKIGGDMMLSGMIRPGRKAPRLSINYDVVSPRQVVLRHGRGQAGMLTLADTGRQATGPIYPGQRRPTGRSLRGGKKALFPIGGASRPRARSRYTPQRRQPRVIDAIVRRAAPAATTAAHRQIGKEIRRAIGGTKTYRYVVR